MENPKLERIRTGLLEKRASLSDWLRQTPAHKRGVWLGPSTEQAVNAHLGKIESSIEKAESGALGRCKVCQDYVETDLLEIDYTACVCIDHLSQEEVRRLEAELELAQRVQKTLLPQEVPDMPGLDVAAYSRPAQIVGGDYFDFIEFGTGHHALVIADVAGHGVSASLHMASIQAMLRSVVPVSRSLADVAKRMHRLFVHNIRFTTFVTLFIGAFDPAAKTFTYCNAGHNPPIVLQTTRDDEVSQVWLDPTGPAIGLVETSEFEERAVNLKEGDLLVMYTDGVTEAMNPRHEEFGKERLASVIKRMHRRSSKEVVRGIRDSLESFAKGRSFADDTTVVVCRIA